MLGGVSALIGGLQKGESGWRLVGSVAIGAGVGALTGGFGSVAAAGAGVVKQGAINFGVGVVSGALGSAVGQRLSKDGRVDLALVLGSGVVGGFAALGGMAMAVGKGVKAGGSAISATRAGVAGSGSVTALFDSWMAFGLTEPC